jgi:RNA polymerase sigma-70 factor (ECF subfamily)
MDPSASTPEELLSHAQWLRRLALRLAGDESVADDLVQETWLAALRRPPRAGGLRPWLARVLTNAARQRHRAASRRSGREGQVARAVGEVPSPEDLALRLEEERRLLAAVGELRDPYKTVVLLRYEEGLSTVDIAQLRGVPAATVRTQLHRALADLRHRMDAGPGGRAAWAVLLAPGAGFSKAGGGVAAAEVIGMSTTTKIGLASAAVVLALVGAWTASSSGDRHEALSPVAPERSAGAEPATPLDATSGGAPLGDSSREAMTVDVSPQEASEPRLHAFEARVVDGRGAPVLGARLFWIDGDAASPASAGDGLVALTVDRDSFGDRGTVRVEAPGFLSLEIELAAVEGERTWAGDVALAGGATITGAVVDAAGGPVVGEQVFLTWSRSLDGRAAEARREGPSMSDLWDGDEQTTTDADGRFTFRSFETGTRMLWASGATSLWTIEGPFEIAAGESRDFELTLEPAERALRISGTVLDPEGRGVAHAHLWYFDDPGRGKRSGKADAEGRFDLLLDVDRPHALRAVDPEGRYSEASLTDVAPGSVGVSLRFTPARWLTVVARGADGEALTVGTLYATNSADDNIIASGEESDVPAEGGRLLEPCEPFLVKMQAEGHAEGVFGPFAPGALAQQVEFRLEAVRELTGVVRHEGRPVPGARVETYWSIGDRQVVYNRGFRATRYPFSFQEATTDADGRFALTPRENPDFFVRVSSDDLAPAEHEVRGYDPQRGAELVFDLTAGGAIHGRVRALRGEEPTGVLVAASRGDANEQTMRVGTDGSFRFEHLMPGRWLVEVVVDDLSEAGATFQSAAGAPEREWNVELHADEEAFVELDLSSRPRALLAGSLAIDGAPAVGWAVGLRPKDRPSGRPSEFPQAVLDDVGRFHLETPVMGVHTLTLTAPGGEYPLAVSTPLELSDGPRDWSLELETGSVELTGVPAITHEHYRPNLLWKGAGGASACLVFAPDAGGAVRLDRVPAGTLELVDYPGGARTQAVQIATFELRPGEVVRASFP